MSAHADERALLAAVAAAPADDAPRLVYADWLDEYGQAVRAEFVRLQVEIARVQTQPRWVVNRHADLFRRQQEILDARPPGLFGPLSALPAAARLIPERGFVSELEVHVRDFLPHAEAIAAAVPLPRVCVTHAAAEPGAFLGSPHLGCVTEVRVYDNLLNPFLAFETWPVGMAAERLVRLDTLDLEGCGLGDGEMPLLGTLPLPALSDLDLSHNAITDAGVAALLDTPLPGRLRRLVLGGNPIGDPAAIALADRWPRDGRLEVLNLRFTTFGRDGHRALLARFGGVVDLF